MAYEPKDNTGALFPNSYKEPGDNKPDYKGTMLVNGEEFEIAGWVKPGKNGDFISMKIQQPRHRDNRQASPAATQYQQGTRDAIARSMAPRRPSNRPADPGMRQPPLAGEEPSF
jgi:hypothetical protein